MRARKVTLLACLACLVALASAAPTRAAAPLPTSEASRLPTTTYYKEQIAASDKLIVWADFRRGENNMDLYGYDLVAKKEVPIAVLPHQQRWPSISGDRIVWWDNDWERASLADI